MIISFNDVCVYNLSREQWHLFTLLPHSSALQGRQYQHIKLCSAIHDCMNASCDSLLNECHKSFSQLRFFVNISTDLVNKQ